MGKPAIIATDIRKRYRLGERAHYGSLRESLSSSFGRLLGKGRGGESDVLWALDGVSFSVGRGEVVGIIGRNGAGKSTLLKILSRVTPPTRGRVDLFGRVGSLLEVGTGFHPELTGRENIHLSGAVLGMRRTEIGAKFDDIVAFSEIGEFLDTPVKRYSSGMYVRLAFAVAAHLEPEILLVDEVLAVGDLAFQQKCLRHMRGLTQSGMTVLLVSHSLASIQSACSRTILIDKGKVAAEGKTAPVIEAYRRALKQTEDQSALTPEGDGGSSVRIVGFQLFGEDEAPTREVRFNEQVRVRIDLEAKQRVPTPLINFGLKRGDGVIACNFNNWYDNFKIDYIEGACSLEGWLPPLRLIPDYYEIHVLVWPWGGAHFGGDMSQMGAYAASTFGDLLVSGIELNQHDGVFQAPAHRWRFCRGTTEIVHEGGDGSAIFDAFRK